MEKDKTIRNQKVFVSLAAIVALTSEYNRVTTVVDAAKRSSPSTSLPTAFARKQALEWVIRELDLPIPTNSI